MGTLAPTQGPFSSSQCRPTSCIASCDTKNLCQKTFITNVFGGALIRRVFQGTKREGVIQAATFPRVCKSSWQTCVRLNHLCSPTTVLERAFSHDHRCLHQGLVEWIDAREPANRLIEVCQKRDEAKRDESWLLQTPPASPVPEICTRHGREKRKFTSHDPLALLI